MDRADEIAANGPERIWLGPKCESDTSEGRRWASSDIWGGGCDECNEKTVEYIRADIAAEAVERALTAQIHKDEQEIAAKIREGNTSPSLRG